MAFVHLTPTVHHTVYPAIDPSNPSNSAAGKTVIISGGASGIGYGIAQGFSVAGATNVVLLARRQEALDEASAKLRAENAVAKRDTSVWTYLLDIRDSSAADSVFEAIRDRLNEGVDAGARSKDADILVTSAANVTQGTSSLDFGSEAYRDSFETNVIGNQNLVRAFLAPEIPAIPFTTLGGKVKHTTSVAPRDKVILDVSTIGAYQIFPGQSTYGTTKLAFTRILQYLQREVDELEGSSIRIHSFHPGVIFTPAAKLEMGDKIQMFDWDEKSLPSGFAVWLASPAATFLKGRFLMSNWDVEELVAMRTKFEEEPDFCTITLKLA